MFLFRFMQNEDLHCHVLIVFLRKGQGRREAERAPGQYFGPEPVCLKVRRGGGTHAAMG